MICCETLDGFTLGFISGPDWVLAPDSLQWLGRSGSWLSELHCCLKLLIKPLKRAQGIVYFIF